MSVIPTAIIIVVNSKQEILLLQRSKNASHHPEMWENPGGKVEQGETFEQAAVREVEEEAGIVVSAEELVKEYQKTFTDSGRSLRFDVVVFSVTSDQEPVLTEEAFTAWRWVPISELRDWRLAPYVIDDFKELGYL